ncbi:hypothetical protein [Ruminococcus albus]|uniref:Uncharacterized protein n=1 Tax=Ruminococcus albus TaxID=1264 RepID=A0A1I1D7J2_RUMAL|nr:hypothetical protein [Ruminococcus albus]SFB70296.1 hypothetical protein SAMN02910406_00255 [Ruminococcus albus]
MNIIKYPSEADVNEAIAEKEPLLVLISFDGGTIIVSHIDEAMEHHILLAKAGHESTDIDKYFRIVLDDEGADWTFVCPPDYKGISDKQRRITAFYKDGFAVISDALSQLGFMVGINIPKRYRRHFDYMMTE